MKGTNQKLTGVTTFIKKFFPKFNTEQVAIDVGRKRGVCPEVLKKEWKDKSTKSILDGNNVHEYSEYVFGNGDKVDPINERTRLMFKQVDELFITLKKQGYTSFETEKIIFSACLGLSGTVDLIAKKPSKVVTLFDYKSSETIDLYNPFQGAFKPIRHLEDCNLTHYSLQLNLYQYILETENYFDSDIEYKKIIVHLTENKYVPYVCRDMKNEIIDMII